MCGLVLHEKLYDELFKANKGLSCIKIFAQVHYVFQFLMWFAKPVWTISTIFGGVGILFDYITDFMQMRNWVRIISNAEYIH